MKMINRILLVTSIAFIAVVCNSKKDSIDTSNNTVPEAQKELIIYGSENCDHCLEFRQKIDSMKIDYVFKDAEANENYYNELAAKINRANLQGYIAFPVIEIDGRLMVRPEFDNFLSVYNQ